jgi:hypothetical protein
MLLATEFNNWALPNVYIIYISLFKICEPKTVFFKGTGDFYRKKFSSLRSEHDFKDKKWKKPVKICENGTYFT